MAANAFLLHLILASNILKKSSQRTLILEIVHARRRVTHGKFQASAEWLLSSSFKPYRAVGIPVFDRPSCSQAVRSAIMLVPDPRLSQIRGEVFSVAGLDSGRHKKPHKFVLKDPKPSVNPNVENLKGFPVSMDCLSLANFL